MKLAEEEEKVKEREGRIRELELLVQKKVEKCDKEVETEGDD